MRKLSHRIVSLNTWADSTGLIISDVKRLKEGASVLCFQEVHHAPAGVPKYVEPKDPGKRVGPINTKLLADLHKVLDDEFVGYYAPQMTGYLHDSEVSDYPKIEYGNAMFVRKGINHVYRHNFIYGHMGKAYDARDRTPAGKTGQAVDIYDSEGTLTVAHVHGAWFESDKHTNFSWRDEQVRGIERLIAPDYDALHELAKYEHYRPRVILVGDLNVVTAHKTIKSLSKSLVFSRVGGFHLNARNRVWKTRTELYTGDIKEAGHAFASAALNARLRADMNVHSDHAALIVETNVDEHV